MTAKALVLDFGGVISKTMFETHALSEVALGLPARTLNWRGPFDPKNDALWRAMQADKISERDYWMARTKETGKLLGEDWDKMETFVQRARGADVDAILRPEAVEAIEIAHESGIRLAILSNELDLFYGADFRHRLELLSLFEVVSDATYTKILKPDPRAYHACLDALALNANECVFVDDQKRNIDGANAVGMKTVHLDVQNPRVSFSKALGFFNLSFPVQHSGASHA